MLNRQRGAHTGAPHCGSHCHRLGVCLTLHFLWQAVDPPFTDLRAEFLQWGGLQAFTNTTIRDFFGSRGVALDVMEAGLAPLNRAIYNQGIDSNTFGLLASLTAELSHHKARPYPIS